MDFNYTPSELMAAAGAREIKDREVVAVGLGLPVVASFLAKQTHAPHMTMLFELVSRRISMETSTRPL
jgi:glutaconate CoA-transferase subunit B